MSTTTFGKLAMGRKGRTKSRAGCLKCKERRMKCDETAPNCLQCTKKGFHCPGYKRQVKWSTKYEQQKAVTDQTESPPAELDWFEKEARLATAAITRKSTPPGRQILDTPSVAEQSEKVHTTTSFENSEAPAVPDDDISRRIPQTEQIGTDPHDNTPLDLANSSLEENAEILPQIEENIPTLEDLDIVQGLSASGTDMIDPILCLDYDLSLYLNPADPVPTFVNHYFSVICRINSCFDSPSNPLRTDVLNMLTTSPLIWNCVLSMSAAHLYQNQKEKAQIALSYQTEAISCMVTEVASMKRLSDGESEYPGGDSPRAIFTLRNGVKKELLLGIILLGISSTWHDPSSLGIYHLAGARSVFKTWISENELDITDQPFLLNKEQSFLVSLMVYWEALCSFIVDQRAKTLDYLNQFCQSDASSKIYPSPWTGASTSVFIYIAKVGTLMRQRRIVEKLEILTHGSAHAHELYAQLLIEARTMEKEILRHRLPSVDMIEDTGDLRALPLDLVKVARCYRYCALLELYRAFPELAMPSDTTSSDEMSMMDLNRIQAERVFDLACGILVIVQSIPKESTTNTIQTLVLLIAGSALWQFPEDQTENLSHKEDPLTSSIEAELKELRRTKASVEIWRAFVRERIINLYHMVGLDPVRNVAILLEEVWSRMDMSHAGRNDYETGWKTWHNRSHWMDVMHEKRLETMLG